MSLHFKNLTDKHQLWLPAHACSWALRAYKFLFWLAAWRHFPHWAWWVISRVIQNSSLWLLLTKPKLLKWTKRRIAAFCMSTTLMPSTFSPDDIRPTVIWAAQAVWPSYCNILWQNCKILIADSAECNKNICLTRDWSSGPPLACIWDWVSGERRGPPSKILTVVLAILFSLDTWLTMLPA